MCDIDWIFLGVICVALVLIVLWSADGRDDVIQDGLNVEDDDAIDEDDIDHGETT